MKSKLLVLSLLATPFLAQFSFGQVSVGVDTKTGQPVTYINPMGPFEDANAENVKTAATALKAIQDYNQKSSVPDSKMQDEERRAKAELVIAERIKNANRPPVMNSSVIPYDPNENSIRREVYAQFGIESSDPTRGGSRSAYSGDDDQRRLAAEAAEAGVSVEQYEKMSRLDRLHARNASTQRAAAEQAFSNRRQQQLKVALDSVPVIQKFIADISPSDPQAETKLMLIEREARAHFMDEESIKSVFYPKRAEIQKFKEMQVVTPSGQ